MPVSQSVQDVDYPIDVTLQQGIFRITLNTSAKRNTLSEAMIAAISAELRRAEMDDEARVIVIAAAGRVFSAGHDLKEMTAARQAEDGGAAYYADILQRCSHMMQQIVTHPKPVIAEVTGLATAAGCQLVASCDLAVAGRSAMFSTPGVHIGLFCSTPMVALSRNVSRKHAMEMLLTGEMISADRAEAMGLINKVVADDNVTEAAMGMAAVIAGKSQMTLQMGKRAFYEQAEMTLADAYAHASAVMVDNMLKDDAVEGIDAFVEKRDPRWQDR